MNVFSAAAVTSNGALVKGVKVNKTAQVALFCPGSQSAPTMDFYLFGFDNLGLRAANIETVYMCNAGTAPSACSPAASGFIGAITFGADGYSVYVSNVQGVLGGNSSLNPDTIISKIETPSGSYSDLGTCNTVQLRSPLMIERTAGAGLVALNPFSTDTFFDLLGIGAKERISCVRGAAFLARPGANGEIVNINQLFGDNTVGPDGRKAANGFLALGKYDPEGRGALTPDDPVWSELRLWEDVNCDGVAQAEEVHDLAEWNITAIHWGDARETLLRDPFGNEIRQLSGADTGDGGSLRVFDLWFRTFGN
jgi:hypothetical protein